MGEQHLWAFCRPSSSAGAPINQKNKTQSPQEPQPLTELPHCPQLGHRHPRSCLLLTLSCLKPWGEDILKQDPPNGRFANLHHMYLLNLALLSTFSTQKAPSVEILVSLMANTGKYFQA